MTEPKFKIDEKVYYTCTTPRYHTTTICGIPCRCDFFYRQGMEFHQQNGIVIDNCKFFNDSRENNWHVYIVQFPTGKLAFIRECELKKGYKHE